MTDSNTLLSVFGLSVEYRGVSVVQEVTFEMQRGRVLSLIGPNGSGKSTLLKAISGLMLPGVGRVSGQVRYLGQDFFALEQPERAKRMVYLGSEMVAEFPMTVREVVGLGAALQSGDSRAHSLQAMKFADCLDLQERDIQTLSGGERQRVALARAVAQGVRVLILDEALSKTDLHHQHRLGGRLKEFASDGRGVILVSHDLQFGLEVADEVILMKNGAISSKGLIQDVVHAANLEKLYPNTPIDVRAHPISGKPLIGFKPR